MKIYSKEALIAAHSRTLDAAIEKVKNGEDYTVELTGLNLLCVPLGMHITEVFPDGSVTRVVIDGGEKDALLKQLENSVLGLLDRTKIPKA